MNRQIRPTWVWVALLLGGTAVAVSLTAGDRGAAGSLLPHGYCFTWNPSLLWAHVVSDTLIGLAYVSIPVTLVHLVRRRTDLPFNWIVVLFAIFIISCGATHWIEVWTVWNPDYWLSANVKMVTAAASVLTAAALVRLVPAILSIPTVSELTQAKAQLEAEVGNRRQAEADLRSERLQLERRVLQRTEELARAVEDAKAARAMAEEANRLKDRFLAKVSHELRTPLQSTLVCAEILQRHRLDPARVGLTAERIQHNVRAQARMIDDLLDISRILSGKLALSLQQTDAMEAIRRAVDIVRSASGSRDIAIDVETTREGPLIMQTDPTRLEQVIWNLVNNAVQATPDGGRIEVRCESEASRVMITVCDSGKGIQPDDLPHLFEPFQQGPNSTNSHRGLGLGLAITRNIVELFGGELTADSPGAGQGATFTVKLPLGEAPAVGQPAADADLGTEELALLSRMRVLYVEDEPDIAQGMSLTLSEFGATVHVCTNFDAARAQIVAGQFDALLSDLNLGDGHTALELVAILRAAPRTAAVPAIVLSAYGSDEDRTASLASGFDLHLVKPAVATEVARALIRTVGAARGQAG